MVRVCLETHEGTRPSRLPPAFFARLFVVAMSPRFAQCPLAIQLLLQPPQGLLHGLTFFQSDFRQSRFTPLSYASHPEVIRLGMKTLSVLQFDAHHSRHATACQIHSQSWLAAIRGRFCGGEWAAAITPPSTEGPQTGDNPDAHKAARLQIRAQMDMGLCIPSDTRTGCIGNPNSAFDIAPGRPEASWRSVFACALERDSNKHVAFPVRRI